jgi:uncharacterized protein YtpQ (UPF0354 family)
MFRRALSAMGISAQPELLTEREFSGRLLTSIVEVHPDVPIEVTGDLAFTLNPGKDREYRVDLTQHYSLYQMEPERLDVLVHLHTANITEALTLAEVELTRDLIVPLVRTIADMKQVGDDPVISEPLTNDLVVVYAFNLPHKLKYVTAPLLAKAGVERDDLKARAVLNATQFMDHATIDVHEGIALVTCESVSPSSLLFVPEFWHRGPLASIPSIAVMIPDRDTVVAFDADNQQSILGAGTVATELISQSKTPMTKEVMLIKVDAPVEPAAPSQAQPTPAQRSHQRQTSR